MPLSIGEFSFHGVNFLKILIKQCNQFLFASSFSKAKEKTVLRCYNKGKGNATK